MPFEAQSGKSRKIAVIGAGISGMGAAHFLAPDHSVTLFEAEPRLGGHARTMLAGKSGQQPVDTGFIVYNRANYPHMTRLFESLDVPVMESDMSFSASIKGGKLEYGLASLGALFAQKKNLVDPGFLRMVRDILKFNARALDAAQDRSMPLGAFLNRLGMGDYFRDYYLLPLSGAIWSTPIEKILDFPAYALIQFFENHALLHHSGQHQWYTVRGGSMEYVTRLEAAMRGAGVTIRLGCPIEGVRRTSTGVDIRPWGGEWESFDEVVFATHSDDSLKLLTDPSPAEKQALGNFHYQDNDIVLHADASIMPKRKKIWASWNYVEDADPAQERIDLTYWMNKLQPAIPADDEMFVTLNTKRPIRDDLIYDQVTLRHPVYDLAALAAQEQVRSLNGTNRTWFCGAWMKNGFHEDGLASAVDVVQRMTAGQRIGMAAE